MTPEERALRDAWVSEMWPVCLEVPREERARKRQADWEQRVVLSVRAQAAPASPQDAQAA